MPRGSVPYALVLRHALVRLSPRLTPNDFVLPMQGCHGKTGVCANMKTAFQVQGAEHRPQSGKGLRFAHHHSRAENCASLSPGDLSVRLVCLETKLVRSSYPIFLCPSNASYLALLVCVSRYIGQLQRNKSLRVETNAARVSNDIRRFVTSL